MAKKSVEESSVSRELRYTKTQLLEAERYRDQKDLLQALLKAECVYSLKEADEMISKFMKGKVKAC